MFGCAPGPPGGGATSRRRPEAVVLTRIKFLQAITLSIRHRPRPRGRTPRLACAPLRPSSGVPPSVHGALTRDSGRRSSMTHVGSRSACCVAPRACPSLLMSRRAPAVLVLSLLLSPVITGAQSSPSTASSASPPAAAIHALLGVISPTGSRRSAITDGVAVGVQGQRSVSGGLVIVAGVLVSQPRYRAPRSGDLTMAQGDVGLERAVARTDAPAIAHERRLTFVAGAGAGARRYRLRESGVARSTTVPTAYLSASVELRGRAGGVRAELRGYLSRSELGDAYPRSQRDVASLLGLAYHFR